jgi:GAF domain-containing protein
MDDVASVVQDANRIAKLHELMLLDTPAEEAFDRLTRLASKILETPVSLLTLIDANRQFFKSHYGLPDSLARARETPLSHSFCQYTMATTEPLVVEDARKHPILKDNPAVPEMNVIAYLGMPLTTTDGIPLGAFCVIDRKPRIWTEREIEIVCELGLSAMTEIELRAQIEARSRAEDDLLERNRQFERVYRFASTTLQHMKATLEHTVEKEELRSYVSDMLDQLARLDDK